jgi:hypothetical protein
VPVVAVLHELCNYYLCVLLCVRVGAKGGLSALDLGKANWQKISRKGDFPSTRCGSAVTMYKNKALLFGGVFDEEGACLRLQPVRYCAVRCCLGAGRCGLLWIAPNCAEWRAGMMKLCSPMKSQRSAPV